MNSRKTPLPVIKVDVATPCTMSWDAMKPADDAGRRFCAHCQRHVHDLSGLHGSEVEDLLCGSAGNLCVRYEELPGGVVRTLEYNDRHGEGWRTRRWLLVGVIVSLMGGVANAMWRSRRTPPRATMVMGGLRAPTPVKGVSQSPSCP